MCVCVCVCVCVCDLVGFGFYYISTIRGFLMPNTLFTYILNIYDS